MIVTTLFFFCAVIVIDQCACCSCNAGSSFCGRNAPTLFVETFEDLSSSSYAFDVRTLKLLPATCPTNDMFRGGCVDSGGRACEWQSLNATSTTPQPTPPVALGVGSCVLLLSGRSETRASLYRCVAGWGSRFVVGPPSPNASDTYSPNWIVGYLHDMHQYQS